MFMWDKKVIKCSISVRAIIFNREFYTVSVLFITNMVITRIYKYIEKKTIQNRITVFVDVY